jgi:hypothetical protein
MKKYSLKTHFQFFNAYYFMIVFNLFNVACSDKNEAQEVLIEDRYFFCKKCCNDLGKLKKEIISKNSNDDEEVKCGCGLNDHENRENRPKDRRRCWYMCLQCVKDIRNTGPRVMTREEAAEEALIENIERIEIAEAAVFNAAEAAAAAAAAAAAEFAAEEENAIMDLLIAWSVIFLVGLFMSLKCRFWTYQKPYLIAGIITIILGSIVTLCVLVYFITMYMQWNLANQIKSFEGLLLFIIMPISIMLVLFPMYDLLFIKKDKFKQMKYKRGLLHRITKAYGGIK